MVPSGWRRASVSRQPREAHGASSREQVEAFHRAALAQGAMDNGPPGLRPDYGDGYLAAFVLDTSAVPQPGPAPPRDPLMLSLPLFEGRF